MTTIPQIQTNYVMAPLISLAYIAFVNTRSSFICTSTRRKLSHTSTIMASQEAISSLPPLQKYDGLPSTQKNYQIYSRVNELHYTSLQAGVQCAQDLNHH